MLDIEKAAYLNIPFFVKEMKAHVLALFEQNDIAITENIQSDLDKITPLSLARKFSIIELGSWQEGKNGLQSKRRGTGELGR